MEYKKLKFDPEEGFLDSGFYEDTPANSREILQRHHNQTRDFINGIVDRLNCENEGESGLESIKSPKIEGVYGNNGYEQIKDVKRQLNRITLNEVPDGSINDLKLADGSVTNDKIKDKEITSEKFSEYCTVPFSNDTKNINGIPSSCYLPVSDASSFDTFKGYVAKSLGITNLRGKTYNNIRYIFNNGYMYSLNLLTEEFKQIVDIKVDTSYHFFVGKDEKIYFVCFSKESSSDGYFSIYEYNIEYSELILINKIKITSTPISTTHICGVDCDGENVYIGLMTEHAFTEHWHFLFKIGLEELGKITEISESYLFMAYQNDFFFLAGDDLIFNNKIFRNKEFEDVSELEYIVYESDGDNLLVMRSNIFLIDKNTMEPRIIKTTTTDSAASFMHNGYFYKVVGGYIVKLRLL